MKNASSPYDLGQYYQHPREVWDTAKCAKIVKAREKDDCGAQHPFPGLVARFGSAYCGYGQKVRYNGGCIRNGEHYSGEEKPLPEIPRGFKFITRPTWGIYLVRA